MPLFVPDVYNPTAPAATADTIAAVNDVVRCDVNGGGFVVFLPPALPARGGTIIVKNITGSANTIKVVPDGGDTIDGGGSLGLNAPFITMTFVSDGISEWMIVGNYP